MFGRFKKFKATLACANILINLGKCMSVTGLKDIINITPNNHVSNNMM